MSLSGLPDPMEVRAMVSQGHRIYNDPLALFKAGTVIYRSNGRYGVRGSHETYACDPDENSCSCLDCQYRKSISREDCKHLAVLREHLSNGGEPCCWCSAVGCFRCGGSGRLPADQYAIAVDILATIATLEARYERLLQCLEKLTS